MLIFTISPRGQAKKGNTDKGFANCCDNANPASYHCLWNHVYQEEDPNPFNPWNT
jgi:hypothetical protein